MRWIRLKNKNVVFQSLKRATYLTLRFAFPEKLNYLWSLVTCTFQIHIFAIKLQVVVVAEGLAQW